MDILFNMYKVKFRVLDKLVNINCPEISKGTDVEVYINIEPLIRKICSIESFNKVIKVSKTYERDLIANFLNLISHYRLYFSKNNCYSKIYLYYPSRNTNILLNKKVNKTYRDTYKFLITKEKTASKAVYEALELVKIITEYIEGVYTVESTNVESSVIPAIVSKINNSSAQKIIVSSDKYDYQYTNSGYYVIRPNSDKSILYTSTNLMYYFKIENNTLNETTVDSSYFPLMYSVLGDRFRDIPKISKMGVSTLLNLIYKSIQKGLIASDNAHISSFISLVKPEYAQTILNNYKVVDINYQLMSLDVHDYYGIETQIIDKYDNEALKKLNQEVFLENPINLIELTSGTKYKKVNKDPFSIR